MDGVYKIHLVGGAGDEDAVFQVQEVGDDCLVTCIYRDKTISETATDFFEALCAIRRQIESDRLIPFCYGASLNVYPSGMARSMGGGLKAYKLTKGTPARTSDLVGIFEEGPDIIPSHVEVQEQFFKDWLSSLRGTT